MRANRVLHHRFEVFPVLTLGVDSVPKSRRLISSVHGFHDFEHDLMHGLECTRRSFDAWPRSAAAGKPVPGAERYSLPMFAILLSVLNLPAALQGQLKPPPDKADEIRRFHTPEVRGMAAAERLKGYVQRQALIRETPYSQIKWRCVGPELQSGRVVSVDSPHDLPQRLLVGFATGGLWQTDDDGITWTSLFDDQSSFGIGDVAVSRDGQTIWVGTGEANSQRTSYAGTGVFKSTDAGKTWTNMGLEETQHIGKVLIDPRNENTVYVAAIGHLYSQNPERGVYKTTDGGKSWQHVLKIDARTGVIDIVQDPRHPDTLYASAWDRDRRAWNFRESGPGSALYKSTDAGRTWKKLDAFPSGPYMGRTGLAISPSNPSILYAFVDNNAPNEADADRDEVTPGGQLTLRRFLLLTDDEFNRLDRRMKAGFVGRYLPPGTDVDALLGELRSGALKLADLRGKMEAYNPSVFDLDLIFAEVFRSDDGGKSWRKTHPRPLGPHGGYYWGKVVVHPKNSDELYTLGVELLKSTDGGKTWKEIAGRNHADHHVVWIDPRNPKRIVNGNDGGPYLSEDGGQNWRHLNNLPVGQTTTLALDNKRPYNIIVGLQDNGTIMGPSSYVPGRSRLSDWKAIGGGDGSAIAVDPRLDGNLIYTASQFGAHSAWDQTTGERWGLRPSPAGGERPLRFNWISPILISSFHPDIVYLGSQKLHRSLDRGRTWEDLSGDLTKNREQGDVPYSTLKDISESPFRFGSVLVGCDDGTVKITQDHGAIWRDIATPTPSKWVSRVIWSKYSPNRLYVAQNGYREDDFAPYLWRSDDLGRTWTSIAGDLPAEPINVVREDPKRSDILYVGTDMGVYVSVDRGVHWDTFGGGMPNAPVHDLAIHPRDGDLVAATHSRSAWVASVRELQSLTPELRKKPLHLWPIADLRRSARWGYDFKAQYDDSPPSKPTVSGSFWALPAGKAKATLKSKYGRVFKEIEFDAVKGFNFFTIDLELKPWKPDAPPLKDPKDLEEKLKDPYQARRPEYLDIGAYVIEVRLGDNVASVPWNLTAPDSADDVRPRRFGEPDGDS